jgi:hypothetical protein
MKQLLITCLAIATTTISFAQTSFLPTDKWSTSPSLHKVNTAFEKESAVVLDDTRIIEYKVEKIGKEEGVIMYTTNYKLIKINDSKGIEMYNKIYIPTSKMAEVINIRARTITKAGKVINITDDKIKETEEDGRLYKLFAMEGVEIGAEVEYNYSIKRPISVFGSEYFQNSSTPTQSASFYIITPDYLKFEAKGFNGFTMSKDSLINDKRYIVGFDENIATIQSEKYAFKDPYLKRVEYKLAYNLGNNPTVRINTWKDFAKRMYNYYTTLNPKENKALDGYLKRLKLDESATDENKIIAIEEFIKTTINGSEKVVSENADDVEEIIKTKLTNRDGMVKMFANTFDKFGVSYQIVFPSQRSSTPIDETLENYRNIEEIIFYFPKTSKYIAPFNPTLRYPYIDYDLAATRGLFLKTTTIGELKTAIGSFGNIGMEPFEKHAHNLEATLKFDESLDTIIVNAKQIFKGYGSVPYRPIYVYLTQKEQDETTKEILKSLAKSENIFDLKVENSSLDNLTKNNPLIISGTIHTADLCENAGNKILLKIGEIIGQQVEMYQEKERKLPIEIEYPHVLDRTIKFEIPKGYQVKNLNDLNINISYNDDKGAESMSFVSSYTQEGNVVTIRVVENYKQTKYPITQINEFVKVINAAADFNKVVLVLEKK